MRLTLLYFTLLCLSVMRQLPLRVPRCRYRKHSVRIRRGQRHNTTAEPEGVQPRV